MAEQLIQMVAQQPQIRQALVDLGYFLVFNQYGNLINILPPTEPQQSSGMVLPPSLEYDEERNVVGSKEVTLGGKTYQKIINTRDPLVQVKEHLKKGKPVKAHTRGFPKARSEAEYDAEEELDDIERIVRGQTINPQNRDYDVNNMEYISDESLESLLEYFGEPLSKPEHEHEYTELELEEEREKKRKRGEKMEEVEDRIARKLAKHSQQLSRLKPSIGEFLKSNRKYLEYMNNPAQLAFPSVNDKTTNVNGVNLINVSNQNYIKSLFEFETPV